MPTTTLKRDNSWIVELNTPIQSHQGEIDVLVLKPMSLEQIVRWGREEIPSQLALLAEMCGVQERLLRLLVAPDIDRVLIAFSAMLPQSVLTSLRERGTPLATPEEKIAQDPQQQVPVPDQQDPRFPHVDGEVKRFPTPPQFNQPAALQPRPPPQPPAPKTENVGIDVNMPETMRPVSTNHA